MYVQEPEGNKIDPSKMNLDVDRKVWKSFQSKCAERGEIPSEKLEKLMTGYVEVSSNTVESDLDRLVSDYVKQKIDSFLEKNLEQRITKLFDHYLKLHLKERVQAQLQPSSMAFPVCDEVDTEASYKSDTEPTSNHKDSNLLFNAPSPALKKRNHPLEIGQSVTQNQTSREKTSLLKTSKELANILNVSSPYIATLNRIGELEKRGWKDSGQRRGKSILYEPVKPAQS